MTSGGLRKGDQAHPLAEGEAPRHDTEFDHVASRFADVDADIPRRRAVDLRAGPGRHDDGIAGITLCAVHRLDGGRVDGRIDIDRKRPLEAGHALLAQGLCSDEVTAGGGIEVEVETEPEVMLLRASLGGEQDQNRQRGTERGDWKSEASFYTRWCRQQASGGKAQGGAGVSWGTGHPGTWGGVGSTSRFRFGPSKSAQIHRAMSI